MTPTNHPRSIQAVLYAAGGDIGHMLQRVDYLRRIHAMVTGALPVEVAEHVHTAGFERGCLTLHVANSAVATRLRYLQPTLTRALARQRRLHVETVDVRVRPDGFANRSGTSTAWHTLPAAVVDHMDAVAEGVDHRPLADALRRLARAGRPTVG